MQPKSIILFFYGYILFFRRHKPKPLGAIFNDCILRRLHNKEHLNQIHFNNFPIVGFSSFGEIYGAGIAKSLVAIFFMKLKILMISNLDI